MSDSSITLGILAGGNGSRMGGIDKGLMPLTGRPMIEHILERLPFAQTLISANRHHEQYRRYGHPVVADECGTLPGPLNGIATLLGHARTEQVLIVPCDSLPPVSLPQRLQRPPSVAGDGERAQNCCCLLRADMRDNLLAEPPSSVGAWLQRINARIAHFHDWPAHYWNLNTPEDLARLERDLADT